MKKQTGTALSMIHTLRDVRGVNQKQNQGVAIRMTTNKTENLCECGHEKGKHNPFGNQCEVIVDFDTDVDYETCPCGKFKPVIDKKLRKLVKDLYGNQSLTGWKCKECGSTKKYTHRDICHKCYMRDWIKTPKAKTYAEKYNDKNANKRKRKWDEKNPQKRLAQEWARVNIEIIGLCQLCKEHNAEERHHFDYSKPKEVNLLCKRCHYNLHKMLRDNRGYNG